MEKRAVSFQSSGNIDVFNCTGNCNTEDNVQPNGKAEKW